MEQDQRQRLLELENETLKRENEILTHEITELRDVHNKLKQSLDEALRNSRQQTVERQLRSAISETADATVDSTAISEPQHDYKRVAEDTCTSLYYMEMSVFIAAWKRCSQLPGRSLLQNDFVRDVTAFKFKCCRNATIFSHLNPMDVQR